MSQQASVVPVSDQVRAPAERERLGNTASTERPKRYMVIVENDDIHTFPYVIEVLRSVCGHDRHRAYRLTNQVHFHGQAVVWIGLLEHAEAKVALIRGFGPDQFARTYVDRPLQVRMELFDQE